MTSRRNPRGRGKTDPNRDSGGFVALPWSVLDSPAFLNLSHPAKALLLEFARQYVRDNNGRLLASMRHLRARGWKSADVVTRAKRELIDGGFVHELVRGRRPNRASWYALTWFALDLHRDYDEGAAATFVRGGYRVAVATKNTRLRLVGGTALASTVLGPRTGAAAVEPSGGAVPDANTQALCRSTDTI